MEKLHLSFGYKWIALKPNDSIPGDAVILDPKDNIYVGRARHFNLLLPAEVFNTTYARITSCSQIIDKQQFEVLVATEHCEWKSFRSIEDIPENVVRAGTAANGELIFVGSTNTQNNFMYIASILLSTNQVIEWPGKQGDRFSLICKDTNNWVDTSSAKIPNKTVSGGKSADGQNIYVARLLNGCDIVAGQVIPALGIATAIYKGNVMHASYCQVLVADSAKYRWVPAKDGEIPDYAVFSGKSEGELQYMARMNKTLGYVLHKDVLANKMVYEILVRIEQ